MSKVDLFKTTEKLPEEAVQTEETHLMDRIVTKKRVRHLTFIITVSLACFVCYLSAMRYFSWMVQTVIDRTDVHISEIPFPAVTLCPIMNIRTVLRDLSSADKPLVQRFLRNLNESIPEEDSTSDFNNQARMALDLVYDNQMWNTVTFRCEDFFAECTWRRTKRNCCSLFRLKKNGRTLCYSFNSLAVDDPDPSWPWSETLSGRNSGLAVTMKMNASKAMTSKVLGMIHYPEEPYSSDTIYLEGEVHITLDAAKFFSDAELRKLSRDCRRCYFLDEIDISTRLYSKCIRDCRVAYMEKVCDCVPHNPLQTKKPQQSKEYCNATHLECIFEHRDAFYSTGNIYERSLSEEYTEVMDCRCYPNCNYVQYKPFVRNIMEESCSNTSRDKDFVELRISYLRDTIFSYRSAMVYCLLDLLVAICSIIALFLGISFISVVKTIQDHFERRRIARALGKVESKR